MRTIKELLILLRNELPMYIGRVGSGSICLTLEILRYSGRITNDEYNVAKEYIRDHAPEGVEIFSYWWPRYELSPRLEFLTKLINAL